jgi:hypothetical protein
MRRSAKSLLNIDDPDETAVESRRRVRSPHLPLLIVVASLSVGGCQRPSPEPDRANELPFGFIDAPTPGAAVERQIQMYGWAVTVTLGEAVAAGSHTLLAQAVDTQGATRDIGTVTVSLGR